MTTCSSEDECYSTKALKLKLEEHYGKNILVTNETTKETIYTFLDGAISILRDNYKATGLTAESTNDMAGMLFEDEIRSEIMIYQNIQTSQSSKIAKPICHPS